jgi:5-dehydro-2-deoxygluconokinase
MRTWPGEHVAKCLVYYHPTTSRRCAKTSWQSWSTCRRQAWTAGHELLIEVIPPKDMPADDDTVPRAMRADLPAGIFPDWWKLPPAASAAAWEAHRRGDHQHDPHCRGVLVLGWKPARKNSTRAFASRRRTPLCKGFAVGRSIFADAANGWFAGTHGRRGGRGRQVAERYAAPDQLWDQAAGTAGGCFSRAAEAVN